MANDIYSITTAEADARLISYDAVPTHAGSVLRRGWPWLAGAAASGDTIQDLIETRGAVTSVTNPKANGDTYTGAFVMSKVEAADESFQGTTERTTAIVETLTKVKASPGNVAALGTPDKEYAERTINYKGQQSAVKKQWTHKYRNMNPANASTILGLTPTESGYTIIDKDLVTESDLTATLVVVFEETAEIWGNGDSAPPTYNSDGFINKSGLDEKKTESATGIDTTDVAALLATEAVPDSGYVMDRATSAELNDRESRINRTQSKLNASTTQYTKQFTSSNGNQQESEMLVWRTISSTNADTIISNSKTNTADMTGATPASPASHVLASVGKSSNGNGSFNVVRVTFIPKDDSSSYSAQADVERAPWRVDGQMFKLENGASSSDGPQMVRTDRKSFATYNGAQLYADKSSNAPENGHNLGYIQFDQRSGLWQGYKVRRKNEPATTPFVSTGYSDGS